MYFSDEAPDLWTNSIPAFAVTSAKSGGVAGLAPRPCAASRPQKNRPQKNTEEHSRPRPQKNTEEHSRPKPQENTEEHSRPSWLTHALRASYRRDRRGSAAARSRATDSQPLPHERRAQTPA